MLSGVLNSDTAIDMNIRVMRAFVSMRAFLLNGNIAAELNQLHCRVKNWRERRTKRSKRSTT